jgi:hypothetical protein
MLSDFLSQKGVGEFDFGIVVGVSRAVMARGVRKVAAT